MCSELVLPVSKFDVVLTDVQNSKKVVGGAETAQKGGVRAVGGLSRRASHRSSRKFGGGGSFRSKKAVAPGSIVFNFG